MSVTDLKHGMYAEGRKRVTARIRESWKTKANVSIFLTLLVVLVFLLPAFGFGSQDQQLYITLAFAVLIVSGLAIAWEQRVLFWLTLGSALASLTTHLLVWHDPTLTTVLWHEWLTLLTIALFSTILLRRVFRPGSVTITRIQSAIAVYLLFGIGWAHAYHVTAILHPGSFNIPTTQMSSVVDWFYYSYTTLTTVGYGDIIPVRPIARNLAIAEALTGQLYLAVLIARLVAMEVVTWQSNANKKSE